jgi:hypothetical protein
LSGLLLVVSCLYYCVVCGVFLCNLLLVCVCSFAGNCHCAFLSFARFFYGCSLYFSGWFLLFWHFSSFFLVFFWCSLLLVLSCVFRVFFSGNLGLPGLASGVPSVVG